MGLTFALSAGEHESDPVTQDNDLVQEDQRLKEQAAAVARAARIADQQQQSQGPISGNQKNGSTKPVTQDTIPMTPGITLPETIIINQPTVVLSPANTPEGAAYNALEHQVATLQERIESAPNAASVNNALKSYRQVYGLHAGSLSPEARTAFEPTTVLYNLITQYQPQGVVETLTGIRTDVPPASSTQVAVTASRQEIHTSMTDFVTKIDQVQTLYTLLSLQGDLLNLTKRAQATTNIPTTIDAPTYALYANQWQEQYAALQEACTPTKAAVNMFNALAINMQNIDFIDMKLDVDQQVAACQAFKDAYNNYRMMYAGLGLDGKNSVLEPGLFDFVDDMSKQIQRQIESEVNRRAAQGSWQMLLFNIRQQLGLQPSISDQLKDLSSDYLLQTQNKMYTMSLLDGALTPEHISDLATIKSDMDAIKALAALELKTLSIADFRKYLQYSETTETIDQQLTDIFVEPSGDSTQQYTVQRPDVKKPLLKPEYVKLFIQYRLLGLREMNQDFQVDSALIDLFINENNLWDIDVLHSKDGLKKEKLQTFIQSLVVWDPVSKSPKINFNQDSVAADQWTSLTQAIQTWAQKDIARLEEILHKPEDQKVEDADLVLVRSYLQLRAALVQKQGASADVATMQNLADMCNSLFGKGIIAQALAGSEPVQLQPFKKNAIGMLPFYYGNTANKNDGGIVAMYTAIQASYTQEMLAAVAQQQQNADQQDSGYKFIPYVAMVQLNQQNTGMVNPNAPAEGGGGGHGGHGGHGGGAEEADGKKCYDAYKNEIKCPEEKEPEDPEGE